jgi:hypothetical protein
MNKSARPAWARSSTWIWVSALTLLYALGALEVEVMHSAAEPEEPARTATAPRNDAGAAPASTGEDPAAEAEPPVSLL